MKDGKNQTYVNAQIMMEVAVEKLPWLAKRFDLGRVCEIDMREITISVMYIDNGLHLDDGKSIRIIRLFSEDGDLVGEVGLSRIPRRRFSILRLFGSHDRKIYFLETVAEAIKRIGFNNVSYGITIERSSERFKLIIGRFPNKLEEWWKTESEKSRQHAIRQVEERMMLKAA